MDNWLLYLITGAFAGFVAGLFGVGGGLIIVPVLTFIFAAQQFPDSHVVHLALGTSFASIIFTSLASLKSHHKMAAVDWALVRRITPGILLGTFMGTWLAALLSTYALKIFFAVFEFYVATQLLLNIKPKPARTLPGAAGTTAAGMLIGGVSSLVGIGGGTLSVPFMLWCNVTLHRAIGTSSAIGFPIAIAGTLGYMVNGLRVSGLPEWSVGFVYLPALALLILASVITSPVGAKLAHRLSVAPLRKLFAVLLYILGIKMAASLF